MCVRNFCCYRRKNKSRKNKSVGDIDEKDPDVYVWYNIQAKNDQFWECSGYISGLVLECFVSFPESSSSDTEDDHLQRKICPFFLRFLPREYCRGEVWPISGRLFFPPPFGRMIETARRKKGGVLTQNTPKKTEKRLHNVTRSRARVHLKTLTCGTARVYCNQVAHTLNSQITLWARSLKSASCKHWNICQ